jgi:hypothetical protein
VEAVSYTKFPIIEGRSETLPMVPSLQPQAPHKPKFDLG